jgi:site-specific DNA-adenine methylase
VRPLFPFYGSKWRSVPLYPAPNGRRVIEPFAGSACYSVRHEPASVLLIDKDPVVVGVWQYLIRATAREILALPDLEPGQHVDTLHLPQEARWLVGFWINPGSSAPRNFQSVWTTTHYQKWHSRTRERIAGSVGRIRHWQVRCASYETAPDVDALWFVDPPYIEAGKPYRHRLAPEEYPALAAWCRTRRGSVVVCEQEGATWLPFVSLATVKASRGVVARSCLDQRVGARGGSVVSAARRQARDRTASRVALEAGAALVEVPLFDLSIAHVEEGNGTRWVTFADGGFKLWLDAATSNAIVEQHARENTEAGVASARSPGESQARED